MQLSPEAERLFKIFFPIAFPRYLSFLKYGTRLVHYTSADSAMSILRTK